VAIFTRLIAARPDALLPGAAETILATARMVEK
jgi:hypothetical protein